MKCHSSLLQSDHSVVFVGDYNVPYINWRDMTCPETPVNNAVLNFAIDSGCSQFVFSPTRHVNTLDLVFSTDALLVLSADVVQPFSSSDHASISFTLDCSFSTPKFFPKPDFRRADYMRANGILSQFDWIASFINCVSVEQLYTQSSC